MRISVQGTWLPKVFLSFGGQEEEEEEEIEVMGFYECAVTRILEEREKERGRDEPVETISLSDRFTPFRHGFVSCNVNCNDRCASSLRTNCL